MSWSATHRLCARMPVTRFHRRAVCILAFPALPALLASALLLVPRAFGAGRTTPPALAVAESLWVAGDIDACRQWLTGQIATARPACTAGDSAFLGDLLALRGQVNARVGQPEEAETDLREAIELAGGEGPGADRAGRAGVVRRSLRWLGFALLRQGRNEEALALWHRLAPLSHDAGDREHEGWAWTGIAFESWRAGQAQRSIEEYARADSLFREAGDDRGWAYARNGMGTALQSAGRYAEAIEAYETAAGRARDLSWPWLEAIARNNIGAAYWIVGDPGAARGMFLAAVELHLAAGDAAEVALAGANVAKCDAALGRYEEAARRLDSLREECRQHGIAQLQGSLTSALAGVRREQGRDHAAVRLFRESASAGLRAPAKARVEALIGLARTLADLDSAEAGLAELERHQAYVDSLDDPRLQVEFCNELGSRWIEAGRPGRALDLLSRCARQSEAHGWRSLQVPALAAAARAARRLDRRELALQFLESARDAWEAERGLPADPEWRERRAELAIDVRQQLGSLLAEFPRSDPGEDLPRDRATDPANGVSHDPLAHPAAGEAQIRARAAFDAVQIFKARTALERMSGPSGADVPAEAFAPITCAGLQEEILESGELLLDFYFGAEESFYFAVSRHECRRVSIGPMQAWIGPLGQYARMVAAPPPSDRHAPVADRLERARQTIRSALLAPVDDMIEGSRALILVPDGILHRVSFAALLADPLKRREAGDRSLPSVPILQVVPSATILAQIRRTEDGRAAGDGKPSAILALRGTSDSLGRTLHGAREEVRDLRRRFRHVTIDPRAAAGEPGCAEPPSRAERAIDLSGHTVLHFASHAVVHEEWPWRSEIRLEDGAGGKPGAGITAGEIVRMRLDARLAVLSSCRTAGGQLVSGEGVLGLGDAFLLAGVPAVVATLWPVEDGAASYLMPRFYDGLAAGLPVGAALAQAQAALRRHRSWSDPDQWAAWIVLGDGSRTVPVERRPTAARIAGPIGLILAGLLALGGGPILRYVRRRV